MRIGDWRLAIGDLGFGIGDWVIMLHLRGHVRSCSYDYMDLSVLVLLSAHIKKLSDSRLRILFS